MEEAVTVSPDSARNVSSDLRVVGEALARISRTLHEHTRRLEIALEERYASELDNPRVALLSDSLNVSRVADLELGKLNESIKNVAQKLQAASPGQSNENSLSMTKFEREREALGTGISHLKRERNELSILYEIAGTLNSALEFDEALRLVMDRVIDFVKAERGFLMLINPDTKQPEFRMARDKEAHTIPESEFAAARRSTVMRVINTRTPVLTDNAQSDKSLQGMESIMTYDILSIMCTPLIVRNTCIGAIYVDSRISANLFAPRHLDLMLAFCNQAAIAIDNARLFAQVQEDKRYMENILTAISNGVITTDSSGIITTFSPAAGEILRLNPQSALGKNYQEVFSELPFVGLAELLQNAITYTDHSTNMHYSVDIPGRGLVTLRLYISSLRDNQGRFIGTVLVIDDSSEFEQNLDRSSSPTQKEEVSLTNGNTASSGKVEGQEPNSSTLHIRILEEPLTAQNFTTIISTLTELHTKSWLIRNGRFADLVDYTQTHNVRFPKEANLIIDKLTHNSPADIKFSVNADASPQGLVEALKIAIDGIAQAPMRKEAAELENHAKESEIRLKEQEAKITFEDKKQNREIEAQKAELERQKSLLEIERQQLQLQKIRLELTYERMNLATETSRKMVETLYPGADEATKVMLIQSLLPQLFQLENCQGLTLALPISTTDRSNTL